MEAKLSAETPCIVSGSMPNVCPKSQESERQMVRLWNHHLPDLDRPFSIQACFPMYQIFGDCFLTRHRQFLFSLKGSRSIVYVAGAGLSVLGLHVSRLILDPSEERILFPDRAAVMPDVRALVAVIYIII